MALLAPMPYELAPLVRALGGRRERLGGLAVHVGRVGGTSVAAIRIGVGTRSAARSVERLLDAVAVDHAVVVGIAGGVRRDAGIGDLVVPDLVVDAATGAEYRPHPFGDAPAQGALWTSDELLRDPAVLETLDRRGVVGLDMETAAVAAVCERRGCRWSAIRAISDRPTDAALDASVSGLVRPDGSPDLVAVARYLLPRPARIRHLLRFARDMRVAARVAAEHAVRACARAGEPAPGA